MSRIGITFEEVKTAIAELQGKQRNPTVDAIREVLGTGSKSTIARFLREWKAQHGLHNSDNGRLPSDLLGIVNGLWDSLRNKADTEVTQYRQESDTKVVQVQQQLHQARQAETAHQQNIHSLEESLHQKKETIQQLEAKLITESQEKIKLSERIIALESRRQEHKEENQRLHQLLKHVQDNLEHYQTATQKLREEQSLLMEKQRNDYEQRLLQLLTQVNAATNEKSSIQAQHDQLAKAHESLGKEHTTLTNQYVQIQGQYESLKIVHGNVQHDHDAFNTKNEVYAAENKALQHTIIELQLNIQLKDEKIASLESSFNKANDKIESLRHESQFIMQEKASLEGQLKQLQWTHSGKTQIIE